jgi:hypothetical protein
MGTFQNGAVIAGLAKLIGHGESGDTGAKDDNLAILVAQSEQFGNRGCCAAGDHAQRPGNAEDGSGTAGGGDQIQEFSTGNWS